MVKLAYFYTPTDRTEWPNDLFMNFKGPCPRIPSAIMRIEHTFLRYTFKWNNISIHVVWHCHFELKFDIDCNFNYAKFGFFYESWKPLFFKLMEIYNVCVYIYVYISSCCQTQIKQNDLFLYRCKTDESNWSNDSKIVKWNQHSHWLKGWRQRHVASVIQILCLPEKDDEIEEDAFLVMILLAKGQGYGAFIISVLLGLTTCWQKSPISCDLRHHDVHMMATIWVALISHD